MENLEVVEQRVRGIMELYGFETEPMKLKPRVIISDELDKSVNGYFQLGESVEEDVIILRKDYEFIEAALAHELTHLLQVEREGVEDPEYWFEFEAIAVEEYYQQYYLMKNPNFIRFIDTNLHGIGKEYHLNRLFLLYRKWTDDYRKVNFTQAVVSVNKILNK